MNKLNKKNKKVVIFDLDGTLYQFEGGSIKKSGLYRAILCNTEKYIVERLNKSESEAKTILEDIIKKYNNSFSIALEEKYGLDRYKYFNTVWDLPAKDFISPNPALRKTLVRLKKDFELVVLSDAPKIWINKILKELKIDDLFKNIFSGEGDVRKEFNNAFENIVKKLKVKPENCIVFGDQEKTDIIPASNIGIKTVFVNRYKKSDKADYNISNILDLDRVINSKAFS